MVSETMTYRVPYADTDQMGVVYYANHLIYFERVRNEVLRSLGFPYTKMEEQGVMLPVLEAHCDYKQAAKYDDLLTFTATIGTVKGCRMRMENTVHNEAGDLLSSGWTVHCFMSSETRKPIRVPQSFLDLIEQAKENI